MNKLSTNFIQSSKAPQKKEGTQFSPARVKDIILNDSHPEYEKLGGPNSIGAIKYELVGKNTSFDTTEELAVAFPINNSIRITPLINEIVLLTSAPDNTLNNIKGNNKVTYYHTVVGLWNHPNHNGSPSSTEDSLSLGEEIEELSDVNPLYPYPGDIIVEGRQGQSIRLTGYKSNQNRITDDSNNGKPLTILSNGQKETENGYEHINEDINLDKSSIYLTSDHIIPLEQVRDKYDALNENPINANSYKGAQVIVNSGRLFFNAYDEDINFSSNEKFSITSKTLGLDAVEYIGLDAEKIYLGKLARTNEQQPVILGDELESWLKEMSDILIKIGTAFNSATTTNGGSVISLIQAGQSIIQTGQSLGSKINPGGQSLLKSKKTFTE